MKRLMTIMWWMMVCSATVLAADIPEEFKIKRQEAFEFAKKPSVTRKGDTVTVTFETKALCDVTVVIEDADGTIVRHLASGVLGENAPPPFQKNALNQTLVWDGKDDHGVYIDAKDALTVRVSLGLKPQFERSLLWAPRRRPSHDAPLVAAAPEGVYVLTGGKGMDSVILYGRDGDYVRTVYPFPAGQVDKVRGLVQHTFPQDGRTLPLKQNFLRSTLLTSGTSGTQGKTAHYGMEGIAASAMAVGGNRIALAYLRLNRLATDGSSGGLRLEGPATAIRIGKGPDARDIEPISCALSPDGKTLYLTGYHWGDMARATQDLRRLTNFRTLPVVMKLDYESGEELAVFKGSTDLSAAGKSNDQFNWPVGVDVDTKGRVYIADYFNDRVQILAPDGRFLKSLKTPRPADVAVHRKTGDIVVFSCWVRKDLKHSRPEPTMRVFGPFDAPAKKGEYPLGSSRDTRGAWGLMWFKELTVALDSWSDKLRIWVTRPGKALTVHSMEQASSSVCIFEVDEGKLRLIRDFARDVEKKKLPLYTAPYYRQRLYVNPQNGHLYVAEGDWKANGKSFHELIKIDPLTGRPHLMPIPFNAEDMCFDQNGMAYLRTVNVIARYDAKTWREVPYDYGEARSGVGFGWMSGTKKANLISCIVMPSDGNWHHGGIHVAPTGHLAVACTLGFSTRIITRETYQHRGGTYQPRVFPGRLLGGGRGTNSVHVFDQRGQIVFEDAIPGLADLYGVAIDRHNAIYLMSAATRILNGKPYHDRMTGTLMKLKPKKSRVLTTATNIPIPLPESQYPDRPRDIVSSMQGSAWVEEAEWLYGGVGFGGKNPGNGCACWNARFAFDYLRRSFAPEVGRYSVAVLDSAGNLILRIGRYGNADDGVPLVAAGGPPNPRSLGGDEVVLFHAPYLATHTDHRLFIADPGNGRILSVTLGYHASEEIRLKDVADK
jgi:DNA-binding beta-propeller fold protein YncE